MKKTGWIVTDPHKEYFCDLCGDEIYEEYCFNDVDDGDICVFCYLDEFRDSLGLGKIGRKRFYYIIQRTLNDQGKISRYKNRAVQLKLMNVTNKMTQEELEELHGPYPYED